MKNIITKTCKSCNKTYIGRGLIYCSRKCLPGGFKKEGYVSYVKGRHWKLSDETCKRISVSAIGRVITLETKKKMSQTHKKRVKNGLCHLFKGGISAANQLIRGSSEYRIWRESIFKRDNYTCQDCGARSGNGHTVILNADHIKPFAYFPELRFELDNGRTLCRECHKNTPTFGWKLYNKQYA